MILTILTIGGRKRQTDGDHLWGTIVRIECYHLLLKEKHNFISVLVWECGTKSLLHACEAQAWDNNNGERSGINMRSFGFASNIRQFLLL